MSASMRIVLVHTAQLVPTVALFSNAYIFAYIKDVSSSCSLTARLTFYQNDHKIGGKAEFFMYLLRIPPPLCNWNCHANAYCVQLNWKHPSNAPYSIRLRSIDQSDHLKWSLSNIRCWSKLEFDCLFFSSTICNTQLEIIFICGINLVIWIDIQA